MKKLLILTVAIYSVIGVAGCSQAPADEPAPAGAKPEVVQADPGMQPPEQRVGAQREGGSEGDAD